MKVLVACEFSQVVQSAFKAKGCDAWSCDLVPTIGNDPEHHIIADARDVVLNNSWDLVIAHPPCTYLCRAGAFWLNKRPYRFMEMDLAREFFMFFYDLDCKVCIENPVPTKRAGLPQPSFVVNPKDFGEVFSKETWLWLKKLPPFLPIYKGYADYSWVYKYRSPGKRSIFSKGIAEAMADAWCE